MKISHAGLILVALVGCDGEKPGSETTTGDTGTEAEALAIAGTWVDGFGTSHDITETLWTQVYEGSDPLLFHITIWDNTVGYLIAENDVANAFGAGQWSRFDWVEGADGHLYYCQTAFDAGTEEAAEATARADDTDPAATGCGGFSWTDLTP